MARPTRLTKISGCARRRSPRLIRSALAALAVAAAATLASCGSADLPPGQAMGSGPAASGAAAQLPSCTAGQWSLVRAGAPFGDGPDFFIPFRGRYQSGPQCRLSATVTGRLLGAGGVPIRHASAGGTIHAILGPGGSESQTSAFAFLWSNWCARSGSVTAQIRKQGQAITIAIRARPMCVDRHQPVGFRWHRM